MPSRNPELSRTQPVFAGFDEGHYDLPQDLLAARRSVVRLEDAYRVATAAYGATDPARIIGRLTTDLPVVARNGDLPPDWVQELLSAQQAQSRASAELTVLSDAIDAARADIVGSVRDMADEVITDYLRPALEDTLAKVAKWSEVAARVPWDQTGRLAKADKAVRDTFALVEEANVRYAAIRSAQVSLRLVSGEPEQAAWDLFSEIRNLPALWPNHAWRVAGNRPPWPADHLARLVWLASPGVETWLPTAHECDRLYAEHAAVNAVHQPGVVGVYGGA